MGGCQAPSRILTTLAAFGASGALLRHVSATLLRVCRAARSVVSYVYE
jgi:hypothetical protein